MIKKSLIILITLQIAFSCDYKKNKDEIAQLKIELAELKIQKLNLSERDSELKEEKYRLQQEIWTDYASKEETSYFFGKDSWLTIDYEKMLRYAFRCFNLFESDVEEGYAHSYILAPMSEHPYSLTYQPNYANYMLTKVNRDPENLKKIFTPELKELAYLLLSQDNLYRDCGAYAIVKALLISYQDLKDDKGILPKIIMLAGKYRIDSDHEGHITNLILPTVNQKVLDALSDENYTTYDNDTWSTLRSRLRLVYGFWARRHSEGNMEYAYTELRELHKNVAGENLFPNPADISEEGYQ